MAKYDKDTKFYWLQLKEDFFEDDAIEWLEEQKPNGRDYAYFYLKLCLKSLKSNGVLVRKVGKILIPYDNQKLAELTKMDFDTVTVAMELLKKIGLIQILENGEIYINQLENLIGSKSVGAFKKQQQRTLRGQKEDNCPPKIEIELEKEKELEIELEKDSNNVTKMLPNANDDVSKIDKLMIECLNTTNINNIMECTEYLNQIPIEVIEYALRKTARISQPNWKYAMSILDSYVSKKIDTLEKAKADDLNFKTNNKSKEESKKETIEEANARKLKALEEMMKK